MSHARRCPRCGGSLPPETAPESCPRCLIGIGLDRTEPGGETRTSDGAPRWPAPAPDEIAADFPQLEILELLGQGGMGVVYKARQRSLDRLVALKILAVSADAGPTFAERFSREARALASLSHPSIVTVYDFGQAGGRYFLTMEYVDGANLHQLIHDGEIAPRQALQLVGQICDALQFAHDAGVVHRDIKPENILVDQQGRVKIADFGLARMLGKSAEELRLTGAGQVMGTAHYMAPEQIERPLEVDHRADIYSLGVVFYELLTGELPLGRFEPPSKKIRVDVRLDEVVLKTLEKEPRRRYQKASEIKTAVDGIASSPAAAGGDRGPAGRGERSGLGWPAVAIAAIVLLGVMAVPVIWMLPRERGHARPAASAETTAVSESRAVGQTQASNPYAAALVEAAGSGHLEGVLALLERGVDLEATEADGTTPLLAAIDGRHDAIVELLLSRGADVNHADGRGLAPLHLAVESRRTRIAELLLEAGAAANARGPGGDTPLILAVKERHDAIVQPLLEAGADPEAPGKDGNTALSLAAAEGRTEILEWFRVRAAP